MGACRGSARTSRRAVTGRRVRHCDRSENCVPDKTDEGGAAIRKVTGEDSDVFKETYETLNMRSCSEQQLHPLPCAPER
ncbi:uncharacterized protein V6R79_023693 [Siganus canaliculatus]